MRLRPACHDDPDALAVIHAASFAAAAWPASEIGDLLSAPGGYAVVAETSGPAAQATGFIICRVIAGDAEVLTLAVDPAHRRHGLGQALLEAGCGLAQGLGAQSVFLEVAADNDPAIALYESAGFGRVGLRRGYYAKGRASPTDALVYRRALNSDAG